MKRKPYSSLQSSSKPSSALRSTTEKPCCPADETESSERKPDEKEAIEEQSEVPSSSPSNVVVDPTEFGVMKPEADGLADGRAGVLRAAWNVTEAERSGKTRDEVAEHDTDDPVIAGGVPLRVS